VKVRIRIAGSHDGRWHQAVIAETDRRIVGVNAADGKLLCETPYAVQGRGYNASTPIVDGQTLIFAGSGRGVKAVKIEKQGDSFVRRSSGAIPTSLCSSILRC
jgi:hypothetical protein